MNWNLLYSHPVINSASFQLCILDSRVLFALLLGTLIRRHRVPRPPPYDNDFYTVEDFNVGAQITLYSKTFHITGCDTFTQNFLQKLGVRVNQMVKGPEDPYMSHRKAVSTASNVSEWAEV